MWKTRLHCERQLIKRDNDNNSSSTKRDRQKRFPNDNQEGYESGAKTNQKTKKKERNQKMNVLISE